MGKASGAKKQRVVAPDRKGSRRSMTSLPWITGTVLVVILGVFVIAISRGGDDDVGPVANRDHWHAAIGFNVCGTWAPNAPEFDFQAASPTLRAGVHSHGDGLIHMHPYSSAEAGSHATVGLWMRYGGWDLDADGFRLWTGEEYRNGDTCPNGEEGRLVWEVNGEAREGNPADYKPDNLDVIAIGFLPEGEELGEPPSAVQVANPADLPQEIPVAPVTPTTGATTDTTATGSTDTTAGSQTTTAGTTP
jgi:hypothetical protein